MVGRRTAVLLVFIALALLAVSQPQSVSAQDYSFTLDQENMLVTVLRDGSVDLDYEFQFGNVSSLDYDFGVDVGLPNGAYDLSTATAAIIVDGNRFGPRELRDSPYIEVGVAVEFNQAAIDAIRSSGSFILEFHINDPEMVYRNDLQEGTAGVVVRPTWFSADYQRGNTASINATILLPEGMSNASEALWLEANPFDPIYVDEETGRLAATWRYENVDPGQQAAGAYDVGVGFPDRYVDVVYVPPEGDGFLGNLGSLICLLLPLIVMAFIIGIVVMAVRSAKGRREDYFDPKMNVVGAGPRRDLTAVEAAVVSEHPLEMVATMILFGLERKGMVKVLSDERPMRLQRLADRGEHK